MTTYENCFDLVHSDVWTAPCMSRENQKYFVTFIDEKSKYTWLTLLPSKDRVLEAFINFQNYATNHFNAKIKVLRSDNGGEYISNAFKQHLAKHGIVQQTSCPYTPQQNGVAERKNRHLMEVARSMMFHTNVPKRFWGDAVMTACYLINRLPTKTLDDVSPYEVLNKTKPSINHLRVFGCPCFVSIQGEQRNTQGAKSTKAMFVGYSATQKGYKCYDPMTRKVLVSRDVKFVEDKGFYETGKWEDFEHLSQSPSERSENLRLIFESFGLNLPKEQGGTPQEDEEPQITPHLDHEGGTLAENQVETQEEVQESHDQNEDVLVETQAEVQGNSGQDMNKETQENSSTQEGHDQDNDPWNEQTQPLWNDQDDQDNGPWEEQTQPLRRSERLKNPASNWINTRVFYNNQAIAHPIQAVYSFEDDDY